MKIKCIFILITCFLSNNSFSQHIKKSVQPEQVTKLFRSQEILPMKLGFSNKDIKKKTNDSTYIKTNISYKAEDGSWKVLAVKLRVRGYFRLGKCYFPPIKIKISKAAGKGTLFEGNKKSKLVLPCFPQKGKNDFIIKEYMAYKLYEIISPYNFRTRLASISFTEDKGKKTKIHDLKGILIEDDKNVAKRYGGKVIERTIHPLSQDPVTSVRNAFFQFMIGNVDFSTYARHNVKLLYVNKKIIPFPYDFDLSGLVNSSYAEVLVINDVPVTSTVTERLYRGFKRDQSIILQVRKEFLDNKTKLLQTVDSMEPFFDNPKEFLKAKNYISDFFEILINDGRFKKEIINKLRTK